MPDQQANTPTPFDATPPADADFVAAAMAKPATWVLKRSRHTEDLLLDPLLHGLPRTEVDGHAVPVLGSVPLLAKLGAGGMGAVYYGIHPNLLIEVAIKLLYPSVAEQRPESIDRLIREAQVCARIKSPNLVGVLDVSHTGPLYYLIMEYVPGVSAEEYLAEVSATGSTISEANALRIIIAAATGLEAAHRESVIHRDIKPANVLIPKREATLLFSETKLADLGLARLEGTSLDLTHDDMSFGTPGYVAPEQVHDSHTASKPSDVFSLGATFYALLAGHAPFHGTSAWAVLKAAESEPHEPIRKVRPDCSAATEMVLDTCLAKKPGNRYADASALLQVLNACYAHVANGSCASAAIPVPSSIEPAKTVTLPPKQEMKPDVAVTADLRREHRRARAMLKKLLACSATIEGTPDCTLSPELFAMFAEANEFLHITMLTHMRKENEVLFPALLSSIPWPDPMTKEAHRHEEILVVIEDFDKALHACAPGMDASALLACTRQLDAALRDDFLQEETVLFERADSTLIGARARQLRRAMKSLARQSQ
ncbi:MAG TPA: protein kinase [Planctomycetota bacterium]|jgi:serine/threonine protein kinase